jgi:hypothetical protein
MSTTALTRATALALAALFLGGVGGASDLDAFLFHRAGAVVATEAAHLETAGNPGCHAERCVLALRLANGRVAPTLTVPVRFESIPQHDAGVRPVSAPHRTSVNPQQQPRAPPAPIA